MSTFAVFGMTESYARAHAEKHTSTSEGAIDLSVDEWLEKVQARVERLLKKGPRPRLSTMYDAPIFAEEFIELAKRERHRDLGIKCQVVERDGKGKLRKRWITMEQAREKGLAQ